MISQKLPLFDGFNKTSCRVKGPLSFPPLRLLHTKRQLFFSHLLSHLPCAGSRWRLERLRIRSLALSQKHSLSPPDLDWIGTIQNIMFGPLTFLISVSSLIMLIKHNHRYCRHQQMKHFQKYSYLLSIIWLRTRRKIGILQCLEGMSPNRNGFLCKKKDTKNQFLHFYEKNY